MTFQKTLTLEITICDVKITFELIKLIKKITYKLMKQTAVDWLLQNIPNLSNYIPVGVSLELQAKFDKAKEMEKEQIIDSFMEGADFGEMFNNEGRGFITDAEQYYNRTFKSE